MRAILIGTSDAPPICCEDVAPYRTLGSYGPPSSKLALNPNLKGDISGRIQRTQTGYCLGRLSPWFEIPKRRAPISRQRSETLSARHRHQRCRFSYS